jgi:WhiB family redox-sensing transcriptional regulator
VNEPEDPFAWVAQSACRTHPDPEDFFPVYRGNRQERVAKEVCRSCPVRAQCLEMALEHEEPVGVWGGLSETERTKLLRTRPIPRRRRSA